MCSEVEIALRRRDKASYAVELRVRAPGDDRRAEEYPIRFDLPALAQLAEDPKAYGQLLTQDLFTGNVKDLWRDALNKIQASQDAGHVQPLRLRLWIDRWSFELHHLRWETLRDPGTGRSLVTDMKVWFSRHLSSPDKRPIRLRLKRTKLRAIVAAASPPDLANWGRNLPPIDVGTVLQQAEKTIGHIEKLTAVPEATLKQLESELRADQYDLLYLVCHGAIDKHGEPFLLLMSDDQKGTQEVYANDLVNVLTGLLHMPSLVLLASCQSAGHSRVARGPEDASLVAIGPRLAEEAGIPAVIAMHGNVSQQTADQFTRTFFAELFAERSDGQIDRALTEARNAIEHQADAWAPVLYSRLVEGRLWNDGAFTSHDRTFRGWETVIEHLKGKRCVPVLGSGLLEHVVGTPQELSSRWAVSSQYPLSRQDFNDLTRVAQFLETSRGGVILRENYVKELIAGVKRLWPTLQLEQEQQDAEEPEEYLLRLFTKVWPLLKQSKPAEAHHVLARLGCPLYITTNPDNLLTLALRDQGKTPQEKMCPWRQGPLANMAVSSPIAKPSENEPLIYQMFGSLTDLTSLVLTEDDYLSYLIGMASLNSRGGDSRQPSQVFDLAKMLMRRGLLFLGFRLDDWDFRLFYRFLIDRPAWQSRDLWKIVDVAVQLNPDDTFIDPPVARQFLERYFQSSKITIYWGSVENFLQELNDQW
jgi:hypothetical protein